VVAQPASVAVIEPDPSYEFASTPRASGGCRVQFTRPENIAMSKFSIEFIRSFGTLMSVEEHASPDVGWIEGGYLFIVPPGSVEALAANVAVQRSMGCNVQLLTPTHPVEPGPRRDKWESAQPITIGDNVWLGGGAIVLPGVTIGDNTVVGAGAVVTRDLPAGVVAYGNPARVVREIGERDRVALP